jgi:two-component system OmpR family response regulator
VDSAEESREVHFRSWILDTTERQLIAPDKVVVALSAAEYRLLLTFLLHPRQVLNRDQLSDLTRGRYNEAFDRSLDVMVSRLRKRLREDAREPAIIKTVRSEGYVLAADPVFKS